jgi:hypothetical protein
MWELISLSSLPPLSADNIGGSGIYSKAQITVTGSTIINGITLGGSLSMWERITLSFSAPISATTEGGSGIFLNGVSNITIGPNNTISYNFAEGVNVRNSSVVNINNSTISNNGQNGLSSGVFIVGTSSVISVGPYNLIENNGGNGITVIEDFNTDNAPTTISVFVEHCSGQWLPLPETARASRSPGLSVLLTLVEMKSTGTPPRGS